MDPKDRRINSLRVSASATEQAGNAVITAETGPSHSITISAAPLCFLSGSNDAGQLSLYFTDRSGLVAFLGELKAAASRLVEWGDDLEIYNETLGIAKKELEALRASPTRQLKSIFSQAPIGNTLTKIKG